VKRGKERDKSNPAFMRLEVCFLVLPKILVFGIWHLVIGWKIQRIEVLTSLITMSCELCVAILLRMLNPVDESIIALWKTVSKSLIYTAWHPRWLES